MKMRFLPSEIYRKIITVLIGLLLPGMILCQTGEDNESKDNGDAGGLIFTIRVRHLSLDDAYEDHEVRLGESFYVADTEYTVKVDRFVPDFAMNKTTKEVISRSDELLNPALLLKFVDQEQVLYESWILYQNLMPHAVRDPGYYFQFVKYKETDDADAKKESQSGAAK
jgi:hypothetical protein